MVNDPIADLLIRIKNAGAVKNKETTAPYSKVKEAVLKVLSEGGCIEGYQVVTPEKGARKKLLIRLKYGPDNRHVIKGVKRVSSPGRHFYVSRRTLPRWIKGRNQLGIVSTSKGVVTHYQALRQNIGGELMGIVSK